MVKTEKVVFSCMFCACYGDGREVAVSTKKREKNREQRIEENKRKEMRREEEFTTDVEPHSVTHTP